MDNFEASRAEGPFQPYFDENPLPSLQNLSLNQNYNANRSQHSGNYSLPLDEQVIEEQVRESVRSSIQQNPPNIPPNVPSDWLNNLHDFIKDTIKQSVRTYIDEWSLLSTPRGPNPHPSAAMNGHDQAVNTSMTFPLNSNHQQMPVPSSPAPQQIQHPPMSHYYNHLRTKIEKWGIQFNGYLHPRALSASEFVRQVTILAKANRVNEEELLQQAYLFFVGDARKWYFTYCENFLSWQHLIHQLLTDYENPNKDSAIEEEMRERKQRSNERFSVYLAEMERLSKSLSYRMNEKRKLKLIFDNTKISYRRRLALTPISSLKQLADHCYIFDSLEPSLYSTNQQRLHSNVHQISHETEEDLEPDDDEEEEVNAISGRINKFRQSKFRNNFQPNPSEKKTPVEQQETQESPELKCWNCETVGHIAKFCLEPRKIYCYACGKPNFTARNCPKQHKITFEGKTVVIPTVVIPDVAKQLICGYDFWRAFDIRPMMSSGAAVTLTESSFNQQQQSFQDPKSLNMMCFSLSLDENHLGLKTQPIEDESLNIPSLEEPENNEIGLDSLETEHQLSENQKNDLLEIIKGFPRSYDGKIGRTHLIRHKIEILPDTKPKKIPNYKYSPKVEKEVDKEIERLLTMDAIEECSSEFVNPLLPVKKPNGNWRLCLDARRLNQMTKRDEYPFPNMTNILERLEKAKYFTIIDLKDAYHQVVLDPDSRDFTAFRTPRGLWRYKTMPFGLLNSGATLCRLMSRVLKFDLQPKVFVYLDDVIVTSGDFEEHLRLLKVVAQRLREANLTISIEKSKFCQKSVKYLGHILSEEGIAPDSAKIEPILNYPAPKNIKEIRRLLGLAGFYQRYIRNYSQTVTPISDLLRKNQGKFRWTEAADNALRNLKSALTSPPILSNPDFSLPFAIETDSSDLAVGAVLTQNFNGERKCIAFFSKKLSATQKRYSATERE
ncbi:uncharacterized protein LOC129742362 [Uranotaenia lowii]|uniref:uncharacterized protein LOC129742362 n=1 Tax=Uranotaenia lowii TaxID=190385 RepID=UPI002478336B|nr:uncharacterized protein LOC129742362 [Uranotaenia lowii]